MKETLKRLRPDLTAEQLDRFDAYYALLLEWNERMNLTAITEQEDVARKHFVDSLAAEPYLRKGARTIDVGTGAGFPGVPLLIVRPDLKLTLLDALNKRLVFLETVCRTLGLNAELAHLRAEDAGRDPAYRERFDAALTRAVAALPVLIELTVPLLQVGGVGIAYKGDAARELDESRAALGQLHARAKAVAVPSDYGVRSLILIEKKAPTPAAYPRRAGIPERKPL